MKKILVSIFLIIIFCMPVFAQYKPIPKELKEQYKKDIEKTIDNEIPIAKKSINTVSREIKYEKNQYVKTVTIEQGINSALLEFYIKLVNVTDKYTNIKQDIPPTDWYGDLQVLIKPYFQDNNIDISKIGVLMNYAQKKQLKLEKNINIRVNIYIHYI